MAPPRGMTFPFPPKHSSIWLSSHVTYEQAVEMFFNQTATQQFMGISPLVSSKTFKGVTYATIQDAQQAHTERMNAEYEAIDQRDLEFENKGIKAFITANDKIRNRIVPTENGLESLSAYRKPFGEKCGSVLSLLTQSLSNKSSNHFQVDSVQSQLVSSTQNVESTSLQIEIVNAFSPSVEDVLLKSIKDGVYVWVEKIGVGHSFVSVFKNKEPTLYSYGRYGNDGEGDGVLLIYSGDAAYSYMKDQLYYKNATVFYVDNIDSDKVGSYFDSKYKTGNNVVNTYTNDSEADNRIKRNGKVIDFYELTSNNCTTHSVSSLQFGGAKLNDNSIPSTFKESLNEDKSTTNVTTVFNFYYSKLYKKKVINESIEDQFTGFAVGSSGDEIISITNWIN